jgi:hypothetical protein
MHTADLTTREQTLLNRAVAHVLADVITPPALAYRNGVTDLDTVRLLMRIESGELIIPGKSGHSWHAVPHGKAMPPLTRIVQECLRLGLVQRTTVETAPSIWRAQLEAAPVHLTDGAGGTACDAAELAPQFRYRRAQDVALVDCLACLYLDGAR